MLRPMMAKGRNCRQENLIIAQNGKKETEKKEWNLNIIIDSPTVLLERNIN